MEQQVYGQSKREIAHFLKSKGIQPTAQRTEIAHFVLSRPQHLSAENVLSVLNEDYERVSLATVYNNLKLFAEKGVVQEVKVAGDRVYYDSNTTPHHHFVDLESGRIEDIPDGALQVSCSGLDACIEEISVIVKGRRKAPSSEPS